jgi:hypothetical protein
MAEHVRLAEASRVFVAGHRGLVGSAIVPRLEALGCHKCPRGRVATEASAIGQLPAEEIKMELGIVPCFRVC